jgi:hypothetical protein
MSLSVLDSTLGAQFLGNLAAAMYGFVALDARIVCLYRDSSLQFLRHHMCANVHILQENLQGPAGLQALGMCIVIVQRLIMLTMVDRYSFCGMFRYDIPRTLDKS